MEDRIQSCGGRESPPLQMGVQSQRHCDCIQHNPQGPALRCGGEVLLTQLQGRCGFNNGQTRLQSRINPITFAKSVYKWQRRNPKWMVSQLTIMDTLV